MSLSRPLPSPIPRPLPRASGVLLHPTSLPGPYGIGDLGPAAYRWVDFLASSGTGLWQILPLGPTGYGDSPYQSFSAFAGNPSLVSPEKLMEVGLLEPEDLKVPPAFSESKVDFGAVIPWKRELLGRAFERFEAGASAGIRAGLETFEAENQSWLSDFSLFMVLKEAHDGAPWSDWPGPLRDREPDALAQARERHDTAIRQHALIQYLVSDQWQRLRSYAHEQGVWILGDIPIFVAYDSADVWAEKGLFYLDESGKPTVVAGVPPDYFSPTGQRWGNPLFRWEAHAENGYAWWIRRFRRVLERVDFVRLDHFRGFAGYWEIPAEAETAEKGQWVSGPGEDFFRALQEQLGALPILAEDLGEITPDVVALRKQFELPGMKVLLFAFDGDASNEFLPHNYPAHCAVYTGTHDNDTVAGWYARADRSERSFARRYLDSGPNTIARDMVRAAWASVAIFALAPLQDLLGLGNEARMNYPGQAGGNWAWRMPDGAFSGALADWLRELNTLYGRLQAP